ncbi:MAG: hypothetical protein RAO94_13795 [Candidatus Stygibacter australis]|nr:hypothetical protein [Candidatus Stygibacter australis]MDP8323413.1 hypothetical protein [Candidatus Stygibacter australis]
MSGFGSRKKDKFLQSIITSSLDNIKDNIASRCKFNFSFMDFSQSAGQNFEAWKEDKLVKLMNKLHDYCMKPLDYWKNQRVGSGGLHVFEIYDKFPVHSDFIHPKHVPHEVLWARFRLESKTRLIDFVIPKEYRNKEQGNSGYRFDCNTFYIVFLDKDHRFYRTKK